VTPDAVQARYRAVLALRQQGLTFEEIGARLGLARQNARNLHAKALRWVCTQDAHLSAESPVEALRIPYDVIIGLQRSGLATVGQVVALSDADLLGVRHIGPETAAAIRADLTARYHAPPDEHDV
jgi:transcriptional regulator